MIILICQFAVIFTFFSVGIFGTRLVIISHIKSKNLFNLRNIYCRIYKIAVSVNFAASGLRLTRGASNVNVTPFLLNHDEKLNRDTSKTELKQRFLRA